MGLRDDVDVRVSGALLELNDAVNQRVKRVVTSHTYVLAGAVHRAALATDDVAGLSKLSTKNLHAKSFAFRLAAVLRTTYTFFMCHNRSVFWG